MCDEAVGHSLVALKLIPDWFVTSKIKKIKNFLNVFDSFNVAFS